MTDEGGAPRLPDADAALAFVAEAVAIPSVSGDERALAEHLAERCCAWADASYRDGAGNVVVEVGSGPLQLLVLGHLDTVEGDLPVRIDGGTLYGRGSVDAKGPLCCALLAASSISERVRGALSVRVVGAVEEEAATSRGARHLLDTVPTPDLLIVAEPSGWDGVTLGYKGRLRSRLEVARPHAHSAEGDPTASERLLDALVEIRALVRNENAGVEALFERLQWSLDALDGGHDGLEQRAAAEIGFRLPLGAAPDRLARRLEAVVEPYGATVHSWGAEVAVRADRDSRLVRAFRAAIRSVGGRARTKLKTGTSDMNVVAPRWRVPMLAYGPGDARLDHSPDERLDGGDLVRAVAVLVSVFERLAAQSPDRA